MARDPQDPGTRELDLGRGAAWSLIECQGGQPHLVGYARVSTPDQDYSMQTDALAAAGCGRIYLDVASGAKSARRGRAAALEYLRRGDHLIVWKLDRFGRSFSDLIRSVDDLRERGIQFRSIKDGVFDTTSAASRVFFAICAVFAEFERDLMLERTKDGLAAARARGRKGGRKPVLTGVKLARARQLIDERNFSVREAAAAVKVSRSTLYSALAAGRSQTS